MGISAGRKVLAVFAFWCFAIFGGAVVMLWNALAPSFSQYRPGDLGYLILQTVSTAAGAGLAMWAADSITKSRCKVLCMVNCVAAATFFTVITGMNFLFSRISLKSFISMGLAVGIFVYCAYISSKEIVSGSKAIEEAEPVMEIFERFAKAAGMTVTEYTTHIRVLEKQAAGMDEAAARRAVELEDRQRVMTRKKL